MGQQVLRYVPIKADIEVNLGPDDLVVYEQRKTKTTRFNFQFHKNNNNVIGWTERQGWTHTLRNYRGKSIVFELRLQWNGDVEVTPEAETTSFDFNTIETKFIVPSRDEAEYKFSAVIHHGRNAKQNGVQLKQAP